MSQSYTPTFAVGKYNDIKPAIATGVLTYPSYIVCTDDNEYEDTIVFVDKDLNLHNIRGYGDEFTRIDEEEIIELFE